ncbi:uncharacterized protein cd8b [Takifugu flavidus]|uniref:Ig-like domain-containing protein n=1 Tax=Takifugu bimaculatus TaxID=433685 RepID=A0A4Z2B821_9TELE|nr:uncharacterized protein cd8b [Takifugu flavidus]TNM88564.1 hypothetical protein fugu_004818 [Takifugu bimaculatus]
MARTGAGTTMILLTLAWTLLTASQASDPNVILSQEMLAALYPKLLSNGTVPCDCRNVQCDSVYWFRTVLATSQVQFLGRLNNANIPTYGDGVNKARFLFKRKTKTSFMLNIIKVTEEDTGIYSCVLTDRKNTEVWKSGILLLPGVIPPTLPPTTTTKAPIKSICRCSSRANGCSSLVLWPLVGILAALALTLICTLYYFSRLPKKCRHRFVKKRLLT